MSITDVRGASDRPRPRWVLALTSAAFFMVALDLLVVITALPAIGHDFRAGLSTLQWTVNAYSLAFAAGIMTAAALGDRLGRRRIFVSGLSLFTVASAACAIAPTAGVLIIARTLQGIGGAMVMPLSLTILSTAFPPERRGAILGIWGGIGGLAIAGGPLLGGAVTQGLSWHWIFWVNVPIGAVVVLLSVLRLPESRGPVTRLDLPAAGLLAGGTLAIVFGLMQANEAGWASPTTIVSLVVGLGLVAGFTLWERRAPQPMVPLHLFRNRRFSAALGSTFLMNGALLAGAFFIAQYLQVVLGYSPLDAGLRFLPMTATPLLVAPLAGMASDRIGRRPVMLTGLMLLGIGLGWFAAVATPGVGYGALVLPLLVAGVGVSMSFATTATAAISAVAPAEIGKASGANSTIQRLGGVLGIAIATAAFNAGGHLGTAAGFYAGLRPALVVAAVFAGLGAVSALATAGRLAYQPGRATTKLAPAPAASPAQ